VLHTPAQPRMLHHRNPFDAIVRSYQRLSSGPTDFNSEAWPKFARARALEYSQMWDNLHHSKCFKCRDVAALNLPAAAICAVLTELGGRQIIARYEHLQDITRFHEVILGLMVFRSRSTLFKENAVDAFRRLSCLDTFSAKKDYDMVDMSRFVGHPYLDFRFGRELSKKLEPYLTFFGYPEIPPTKFVPASGEYPRKTMPNIISMLFNDTSASSTTASADGHAAGGHRAESSEPHETVADIIANNKEYEHCDKLNKSIGVAFTSRQRPMHVTPATATAATASTHTHVPPLLITLPGSGGVWLRKMIEMATGLHTGSLGNSEGNSDQELHDLFVAERHCGPHLAAIYCEHPDFLEPVGAVGGSKYMLKYKAHRQKCAKNSIETFDKMILLIRNPYDAMISAYKQQQSQHRRLQEQSSIMALDKNVFAVDGGWTQYATTTAASFKQLAYAASNMSSDRGLVIKYEDLLQGVSSDDADKAKYSELIHKLTGFVIGDGGGNDADHEADIIRSLRMTCTTLLYHVYHERESIEQLRYSSAPFTPELLASVNPALDSYRKMFGYDPKMISKAMRKYVLLSGAELSKYNDQVIAIAAAASSSSSSASHSSGETILLRYSQPLTDYVPPLVLDGSQNHSVAIARCAQHFGYRIFKLEPDPPPLLLSFAGSGNTWVRLLIEFATGIFSGSSDTQDKILKEEFLGERFCNRRNIVIKAHPPQIMFDNTTGRAYLNNVLMRNKCTFGGMYHFRKYVFLVREPFAAIFAEVNREISWSHSSAVSVEEFLASNWHTLIIQEAQDYADSWAQLGSGLTMFQDKVLLMRYEQLINPESRTVELYRAARFVNPIDDPSLERLQCAFIQSESTAVHRSKMKDSMTAAQLYKNQTLVDELWEYLKDFAKFAGYSKYVSPQN
jgi:hypothetical protein